MSLLSIIMPVYNAEQTLPASIASLLKQTCGDWELIAVDDGSADRSLEMLKEYAEKDSRIKWFHQENAGPGAARNTAIAHATGDYLAFLDADDYWDPEFVALAAEKISGEDPDIIFYDMVYEKTDGSLIRYGRLSDFASATKDQLIRFQMTGKMEWGMVKIIRRSIVRDNNLKFSTDYAGEEAVFSFEVLRRSERIAFIDRAIYHYVHNPEGQHKKGQDDPWGKVVRKMEEHLAAEDCLEQYQRTINSFALRALCIACYRIALGESRKQAKAIMKQKIAAYKQQYDLGSIDNESLDMYSRSLFPLIRLGLTMPICIAANLRNRRI